MLNVVWNDQQFMNSKNLDVVVTKAILKHDSPVTKATCSVTKVIGQSITKGTY